MVEVEKSKKRLNFFLDRKFKKNENCWKFLLKKMRKKKFKIAIN